VPLGSLHRSQLIIRQSRKVWGRLRRRNSEGDEGEGWKWKLRALSSCCGGRCCGTCCWCCCCGGRGGSWCGILLLLLLGKMKGWHGWNTSSNKVEDIRCSLVVASSLLLLLWLLSCWLLLTMSLGLKSFQIVSESCHLLLEHGLLLLLLWLLLTWSC